MDNLLCEVRICFDFITHLLCRWHFLLVVIIDVIFTLVRGQHSHRPLLLFAKANPLPPHIVAYVALCIRAHQDLFPSFVFDVSTLRPLRITSSASRRILIYFMRALLARDADARVAMSPQVDHFDFLLLL